MEGRFYLGLPIIELEINGSKISCIIDTGFNGELLLPEQLIEKLSLKQTATTEYINVDGVKGETKIYSGQIMLNDKTIRIEVAGTKYGFALAGMKLFKDFRVVLDQRKDLVLVED